MEGYNRLQLLTKGYNKLQWATMSYCTKGLLLVDGFNHNQFCLVAVFELLQTFIGRKIILSAYECLELWVGLKPLLGKLPIPQNQQSDIIHLGVGLKTANVYSNRNTTMNRVLVIPITHIAVLLYMTN